LSPQRKRSSPRIFCRAASRLSAGLELAWVEPPPNPHLATAGTFTFLNPCEAPMEPFLRTSWWSNQSAQQEAGNKPLKTIELAALSLNSEIE